MGELFVGTELAQYLIDEGICVDLKDADGTHPVVVVSPRDGAPAPVNTTDGLDLSAGTITVTTHDKSAGEDNSRKSTVAVLAVRAPSVPAGELLVRQLENKLVPRELWGGKTLFQMGAITRVELCLPYRGATLVSSDDDGFVWDMAFELLISRSLLTTP